MKKETPSPTEVFGDSGRIGGNQLHPKNNTFSGTSQESSWSTCGNSAAEQRQRLLEHFKRHGSITTLEARLNLDIFHPAGRVQELREEGELIDTVWVNVVTSAGKSHRIAKYVMANQGAEVAK